MYVCVMKKAEKKKYVKNYELCLRHMGKCAKNLLQVKHTITVFFPSAIQLALHSFSPFFLCSIVRIFQRFFFHLVFNK